MTAIDDLRNLDTALDSAVTGWIGYNWPTTSKTGERGLEAVKVLRRRLYRQWGESCALRSRLSRALDDLSGTRDANVWLTDELEKTEQQNLSLNQKVTELEGRLAELSCKVIAR